MRHYFYPESSEIIQKVKAAEENKINQIDLINDINSYLMKVYRLGVEDEKNAIIKLIQTDTITYE